MTNSNSWHRKEYLLGMGGLGGGAGGVLIAGGPIATDDAYQIEKSLRFSDDLYTYLKRKPDSESNRRTWTWAGWVKKCGPSSDQVLFYADNGTAAFMTRIQLSSEGDLAFFELTDEVITINCKTNALLRDHSAWYHIVVALDTTQSIERERVKIYINGKLQTLGTATYPTQNLETRVNSFAPHTVGRQDYSASKYLDSYLADVQFIDGLQLSPAAFGSFGSKSSVWNPTVFTLPTPNDGTTWSSGGTTVGNWNEPTYGVGEIFDGNVTGTPGGACSDTNAWNGARYTLPSTVTVKSQVRVFTNGTDTRWGFDIGNGFESADSNSLTPVGSAAPYIWTLPRTTEFKGISCSDAQQIFGIEVDGIVLVDGATDPTTRNNVNNGTTWSSYVTGTPYTNQGGDKAFDGLSSTLSQASNPGDASLTFKPPAAITGRVEILIAAGAHGGAVSGEFDLKIGNVSKFDNSIWPNNTSAWVDLGTQTIDTTHGLVWGNGSGGNWHAIKVIKIDGHMMLDSSIDNSFHLKFNETSNNSQLGHDGFVDSTEDTNPVYSACTDGAQANYPASRGFDGSLTTNTNGPNGGGIYVFDFTKIGGVAYTNGVQCYLNNTTNGQYDRTRVNGGSWTTWNTGGTGDNFEWVDVATGSGTMNTFEIEDDPSNGASGAAEGSFKALRINGDTILTDRGGNNFTVNNLSAVASTTMYTSGSDWNSAIWDGSLTTQGGVTGQSYEELTDQSITVNTSFEIYSNDEAGQVNTIKDGNGNEYQCTDDLNGSTWRVLYNANSQSGTNFTGTLTGPIQIKVSYGGSHIYAVRVDGTILTEPTSLDSVVESPTNYGDGDTGVGGEVRGNYCTWDPLSSGSDMTLSEGNLKINTTSGSWSDANVVGTMGATTGKWYWEVDGTAAEAQFGVHKGSAPPITSTNFVHAGGTGYSYYNLVARAYHDSSFKSWGSTWGTGDIIGVALDLDTGAIWFSKNGAWTDSSGTSNSSTVKSQLEAGTTTNATYTWTPSGELFRPCVSFRVNPSSGHSFANFGQRAFKYTAPTGFKCLCSQNLSDTFGDNDDTNNPSKYFDTKIWIGNGATGTNKVPLNFQPDYVWIKGRDTTWYHQNIDAVRGKDSAMYSNDTDAANASATDRIDSWSSTGITLGNSVGVNQDTKKYVGWFWDASTAFSNSAGANGATLASEGRYNADTGFAIVKYTGGGWDPGTGVYHPLGAVPKVVIQKRYDGTSNWEVYTTEIDGSYDQLLLNTTAAKSDNSQTAPTSTLFNSTWSSGQASIAYLWTPIEGYSKFSVYTGNANANGPFVHLGFRPKMIIFKNTNTTNGWRILDTVVNTYNSFNTGVYPNTTDVEDSPVNWTVDYLSNGFKIRDSNNELNGSGHKILYMAFAEHPHKVARAR